MGKEWEKIAIKGVLKWTYHQSRPFVDVTSVSGNFQLRQLVEARQIRHNASGVLRHLLVTGTIDPATSDTLVDRLSLIATQDAR
jgi:hypothetical protein